MQLCSIVVLRSLQALVQSKQHSAVQASEWAIARWREKGLRSGALASSEAMQGLLYEVQHVHTQHRGLQEGLWEVHQQNAALQAELADGYVSQVHDVVLMWLLKGPVYMWCGC